MPPKRASKRIAASRERKEATDSEDEPKSKRMCPAPQPKVKKSRAYKMPPPLPAGELLTDMSKHCWRLGESVGKGGFGEIYRAVPVGSAQDSHHVIKIEPKENGPLFTEIAFYCRAAKEEMISSWVSSHKLAYLPIPKYIAQGQHYHAGLSYRFLVMNCFGEDVEKRFNQSERRFSIKTLCHLALRILEALQYLHESEYAHGDIKGSNLLTGVVKHHEVYLVDYGLACRYRPDGRHREYKEDPRRRHDGTLEFTSIDAHNGVTPSARGDLEILAYCLLQWSSGCLPWDQHVKDDDKDSVARMKIRYKTDVSGLLKSCFSSGSPPTCLREYITYIHSLDYYTTPNYHKAKQMFTKELSSHGFKDDGKNLDWFIPRSTKIAENADSLDQTDAPSPKRKQARVYSRGKPKAVAEPDDEHIVVKKPSSSGRGRKRKIPSKEPVVVLSSIQQVTGCSSATGSGTGEIGIIPQVSYPTTLGYEGNTHDKGPTLKTAPVKSRAKGRKTSKKSTQLNKEVNPQNDDDETEKEYVPKVQHRSRR